MGSIVGFHGTTLARARQIVAGPPALFRPSVNDGDWLGYGVYFWEASAKRAMIWAKSQTGGGEPLAVVAADIDLSRCIDLFDLSVFKEIKGAYVEFLRHEQDLGDIVRQEGIEVLDGHAKTTSGSKKVNNYRDRAFLNWYIQELRRGSYYPASVRGAFLWGDALFKESFLFDWAHSQISVLDATVMSGLRIVP